MTGVGVGLLGVGIFRMMGVLRMTVRRVRLFRVSLFRLHRRRGFCLRRCVMIMRYRRRMSGRCGRRIMAGRRCGGSSHWCCSNWRSGERLLQFQALVALGCRRRCHQRMRIDRCRSCCGGRVRVLRMGILRMGILRRRVLDRRGRCGRRVWRAGCGRCVRIGSRRCLSIDRRRMRVRGQRLAQLQPLARLGGVRCLSSVRVRSCRCLVSMRACVSIGAVIFAMGIRCRERVGLLRSCFLSLLRTLLFRRWLGLCGCRIGMHLCRRLGLSSLRIDGLGVGRLGLSRLGIRRWRRMRGTVIVMLRVRGHHCRAPKGQQHRRNHQLCVHHGDLSLRSLQAGGNRLSRIIKLSTPISWHATTPPLSGADACKGSRSY